MSERIRRLLDSKKAKLAQDTNTNIGIEFKGNLKPFNDPNLTDIVSQQDVFNQERENSKKYRIHGNVRLITTNELSPTANDFDWDFLFDGNPALTPNNWLIQVLHPSNNDREQLITTTFRASTGDRYVTPAYKGVPVLRQYTEDRPNGSTIGVVCYMNHNLEVGDYFYMYGNGLNYGRRGIHQVGRLGDVNFENEDKAFLTTTEVDTTQPLSILGNIIKIIGPSDLDINYSNPINANSMIGNVSGGTEIVAPNHGLNQYDFIEMRSGSVNELNGIFKVLGVTDENKFVIDIILSNGGLSTTTFRRLDGTPSEYYVRKFEVISTNDYETHETAFANTIYPQTLTNSLGTANKVYSFQYNRDIDINGLVSNRGGKVTQLYLGFIKRAGQYTHDWSNVFADWEESVVSGDTLTQDGKELELISQRNSGGVGTIEKINYGDEYIGDFVEFNRLTLEEKTVSEPIHYFRPRTTLGNNNGYYYKPFKKLQVRVYSNNIEEATAEDVVVNLPPDTITYPNGTRVWKDILSVGFYENGNGVDYPFINNSHYFYSNNVLYLRVQTPNRPKLSLETVKIGDIRC
jgi:hypothetical protein